MPDMSFWSQQPKKSLIHLPTPVILSFPSCSLACLLHRVQLFVTPWTVAHQALLSVEFSREYWSGCHLQGIFPRGESPGDPGDQTHISAISWTGRWILYHRAPGKPCLSHKCFHPNEEKPAFPPPTTTIQSVHALLFRQTVMTVFCRKRLSLNSYLI